MTRTIVKALCALGFIVGLGVGLMPRPASASLILICPANACMRLFWDGKITLFQMQHRSLVTACTTLKGEKLKDYFYPADGSIPAGRCVDF